MAFDTYQLNAIENNSKSLVITAGAGSGKTTTMIGRVLRAINHHAITKQLSDKTPIEHLKPEQIQVVSFTNVAADTFKEKLSILSSGAADKVNVSTLDKFAIKIIQHIYPNAKCDLDENEIAKSLYYELNHITGLQSIFHSFSHYFEVIDSAQQLYASASKKLRKKAVYDDYIDAYIEHINNKYNKNDEFSIPLQVVYKFAVITMIEHHFVPDLKLLIVDELQDTSDAQFVLLNFLQSQLRDLKFIGIGDISQSMYRWNNAKPQRVSQYIDEYDAELITLPNNYRSHPQIIDLANKLLENNIDNIAGIQLNAKSKLEFDENIKDHQRVNYIGGIYTIESHVKRLIAQGVKPCNIAILARSGSILNKIQKEFSPLIKLNSKHNDKNKRINYLSFVSRKLSIYIAHVSERKENLYEIFSFLNARKYIKNMDEKIDYYTYLHQQNKDKYYQKLNEELTKYKLRLNEQLRNLLYKANDNTQSEDEVTISTVHGVKGDEFDYVFYIPPQKRYNKEITINPNLDKEEKELLWGSYAELQNIDYVAATRAREQLTIVAHGQNFREDKESIENCKSNNKPYNKDVDALLSHLKID